MTPSTDLRLAPVSPPGWQFDIWLRIRRHLALKLVGTTVFTWLFFIGYFHLLRNPVNPVTVMPLTAVDHWVGFHPWALVPYFSLWVYVGVAPGLQLRFNALLVYGLWAGALCLTGLALFYAWPTQVPPMALPPTDFPGFAILQGVDAAGNACPSMHVAIAIFTAIWVEHILREVGAPGWLRLVNTVWFAAIAWSTLAVRQHVALDVVAGAALGIAFAWPSLHWRPGRGPRGRELSGYHEATVPVGRFGGRTRRG